MQQFLDSIRKAIKDENWFAALFIALTIPDICGKLDDETGNLGTGARYRKWTDKYLSPFYNNKINTEVIYALRNSCLHAGTHIETVLGAKLLLVTPDESPFHDSAITLRPNETYVHLRIDDFCTDVCKAVENWFIDVQENQSIHHSLGDLVHLTGDPTRAREIIVGSVNFSWGTNTIRSICCNIPEKQGFVPFWMEGGQIPENLHELMGDTTVDLLHDRLRYLELKQSQIQNNPDEYAKQRIADITKKLTEIPPRKPTNSSNRSMHDNLVQLKQQYELTSSRSGRIQSDLAQVEKDISATQKYIERIFDFEQSNS